MPASTDELARFFTEYASVSLGPQPEALAGLYAPTFIVGAPTGSHAFANDDRFLDYLRQVATFNREHGMRALTVVSVERVDMSPIHVLAIVTWGAHFQKTGDRRIEFVISYVLEQTDHGWRILSYISQADQNARMAQEGLL